MRKAAPMRGAARVRSKNANLAEQQDTASLRAEQALADLPDGTVLEVPIEVFASRPVRDDEIPTLREVWWRQRRLGHRLPTEQASS